MDWISTHKSYVIKSILVKNKIKEENDYRKWKDCTNYRKWTFNLYLSRGMEDIMSFSEYKGIFEKSGCVIEVEEWVNFLKNQELADAKIIRGV